MARRPSSAAAMLAATEPRKRRRSTSGVFDTELASAGMWRQGDAQGATRRARSRSRSSINCWRVVSGCVTRELRPTVHKLISSRCLLGCRPQPTKQCPDAAGADSVGDHADSGIRDRARELSAPDGDSRSGTLSPHRQSRDTCHAFKQSIQAQLPARSQTSSRLPDTFWARHQISSRRPPIRLPLLPR